MPIGYGQVKGKKWDGVQKVYEKDKALDQVSLEKVKFCELLIDFIESGEEKREVNYKDWSTRKRDRALGVGKVICNTIDGHVKVYVEKSGGSVHAHKVYMELVEYDIADIGKLKVKISQLGG